jgi:predicted metal-dependent hydrolase
VQQDLPFVRSESPPPAPRRPRQPDFDPTFGPIEFVRTRRARRYIIRVKPDGSLRVTIPRVGTRVEALQFLGRQAAWIAKERARRGHENPPITWTDGTTLLVDGVVTGISVTQRGDRFVATYGGRSVVVADPLNLRGDIENDLRAQAIERLIPRLRALAADFGVTCSKVTIRNQRSRWGSCSRAGAIALNFRLVQMPEAVRDYVLIHELMHLKQQNHGPRFWRLVEQACPSFRESERWLRTRGRSLF